MENTSSSSVAEPRPSATLCTLVGLAALCAASAARAQVTESVVYSFTPHGSAGGFPNGLIVQGAAASGAARALYGTTFTDANPGCFDSGCGAAFRLKAPPAGQSKWKEATLWDFTGGSDGGNPISALVASSDRISRTTSLYGTTFGAGADGNGNGTVYSLSGNTFTTIWTFTGGNDGAAPGYAIAVDKAGAVYSAASWSGKKGCGTVIKLTPPTGRQTTWKEETIYTFPDSDRGFQEIGCGPLGVTIDESGALYGVTQYSGIGQQPCDQSGGCGTLFKLTPPADGRKAWAEQTLWRFGHGNDGYSLFSPPVIDKKGVLFGTTMLGGAANCGIAYRLRPPRDGETKWKEEIIWSFSGGDGCEPFYTPIVDAAGAVYGTAPYGGPANNGSVYKLTPPAEGQSIWTEGTLWGFSNGSDGAQPTGPLVADKAGTLYGPSNGGYGFGGGATGYGVIYSLTGTGFVPKQP